MSDADEMAAYIADRQKEGAFAEPGERRRYRTRGPSFAKRTFAGSINSSGPPPADTTPPTITSASSVSNPENSVLAFSLTANESVNWSITGGADSAKFELSGPVLRWLSNGTKDFEAPDDVGTNNTYIVQVTATDLSSNASNQTITVTVTDVTLAAPGTPSIVWTSDTATTPPVFSFTAPTDPDLVVGDTVRFQRSTASDFLSSLTEYTNTVDSGEDLANALTFSSGSWANGTWYVRARTERADCAPSAWSNTETKTLAASSGPPATALYGWWNAENSFTETSGTPTTPVAPDGDIGSLLDLSTNGHHVYQTTGALKPQYKTGILNSLPAARFDGSAYLQGATGPTGNSFSMYAVVNRTADVALGAIISQDDGSINPRYLMGDSGSGGVEIFNGGIGAVATMASTTYHMVAGNVDNTGAFPTQIKVDNGTTVTTNSTGGGFTGTSFDIGALAIFSRYWNGDILEVLIYEAVHDFSTGDGLAVRQYLNTRYNLGLGI